MSNIKHEYNTKKMIKIINLSFKNKNNPNKTLK